MLSRKINNGKDLKLEMEVLEKKICASEYEIKAGIGEVKDSLLEIKENLEPTRLITNTFSKVADVPGVRKILINTAIGFILGYVSKKSTELLSEASLTRLAENFVNHQITRIEQKNPDSLVSKGINIVRTYTPPSSPLYSFVKY